MTDQEIEKLFMQYAYHGQIDLTEAKYFAKAILSRAIPEGHVVVPKIPTDAMSKAGAKAQGTPYNVDAAYRAMITAAAPANKEG